MIEDNIVSFIENLDNKTLTLIIEKDGVNSDATLSVSNEKIYFDTLSEDGTIAIIDSVSIITYDFNDEVIIMETVDNTFLDIFNSNNLSKYNRHVCYKILLDMVIFFESSLNDFTWKILCRVSSVNNGNLVAAMTILSIEWTLP